jgi:hypothetical protein
MTIKLVGNDDLSAVAGAPANIVRAQSFVASRTGSLTEIQIEVLDNVNVMVAVYSDNGGVPYTRLTSSSSTTCTTGFVTIAVSPISIIAGTTYWLAFNSSDSHVAYKTVAGVSHEYKSALYASFTWADPYPTGLTNSGGSLQIAGWGNSPMCFQAIVC